MQSLLFFHRAKAEAAQAPNCLYATRWRPRFFHRNKPECSREFYYPEIGDYIRDSFTGGLNFNEEK